MPKHGLAGWLLVLLTSALPALGAPHVAAAATRGSVPAAAAAPAGSDSLLPGWMIQSSSLAGTAGAVISQPGFSTAGWAPAPSRSTVLGALVDDGRFGFDPWFSNNLTRIGTAAYRVPWWFREDFALGAGVDHTFLRVNGIIPRADVWVNGRLVAGRAQVAGAYNVQELDVTAAVHQGTNTVALLVYPADPMKDLVIGWIDWNQWPPDNNMGPWRGVELLESGPVTLRGPRVQTSLALPGLNRAALTVRVDVHNAGAQPAAATVAGTIAPEAGTGGIAFQQAVTLAAGETRTLTFAPATQPQLDVANPQVWWPAEL